MSLQAIEEKRKILEKEIEELENQKKIIEQKNAAIIGLERIKESLKCQVDSYKSMVTCPLDVNGRAFGQQKEHELRILEHLVPLLKEMRNRIEVLERNACNRQN